MNISLIFPLFHEYGERLVPIKTAVFFALVSRVYTHDALPYGAAALCTEAIHAISQVAWKQTSRSPPSAIPNRLDPNYSTKCLSLSDIRFSSVISETDRWHVCAYSYSLPRP
eukprot:4113901-Pleurochrysis_carterae.AAC.5